MHTHSFFLANITDREQRLCFELFRRPEAPIDRANKAVDAAGQAINLQFDAAARRKESERKNLDEVEWINAFSDPDFLTKPTSSTPPTDIHGPKERLEHLSTEQRQQEFQKFIAAAFPASVREDAAFKANFKNPFDPVNFKTIQQALVLLVGQKGTLEDGDPAWKLAKATMYARNPNSVAGNRLVGKYIDWVEQTKQNDMDAINSARILETANDGELKGAALLGFLDEPGVLAEMKLRLRQKQTEVHNQIESSNNKRLRISGKEERDKLARESQTFMDNFRSLDPRMQLGLIAAGLGATYMLLKSKNWFAKAIPITLFGSWAYLRLFKGDPNAVDNIAEKIKGATTFTLGKIQSGAENVGLLAPKKEEIDKLSVIGNFLISKARRNIEPSTVAFSAIANAKIGIIAEAFTFDEKSSALTGDLRLENNPNNPAGKLLYDHIKTVTRDKSGADREKMFRYFKENKDAIGSAVLHVMYSIGSNLEQNVTSAARIDKFVENGGDKASYDSLPANQKAEYLHIAYEGLIEARRNSAYKDITLVDLITKFQKPAPERTAAKVDGAEKITDVKAERTFEFGSISEIRSAKYTKTDLDTILSDTGPIFRDYDQFLNRCETELKLKSTGRTLLVEQFNTIRSSGEPLPVILQTIEKFKYAILLAIYNDTPPTTKDDVEKMLGTGTLKLSDVYNNLTSFINRNILTVSSHFGTAVDIRSVQSLLVERTGTASLTSLNGAGLPKLRDKMNIYEIRFKELRDTKLQATKIIDGLPPNFSSNIIAKLGGTKDKAVDFIKNYLDNLGYLGRIDRMEQYFAQKCINSLVMAMFSTQKIGADILDKKQDRAISPIEEENLEQEFDMYFDEICKDTATPNMWENAEQLAATTQPFATVTEIKNANFKDETIRLQAVNHVKDLFTATVLASRNNTAEAERLLTTKLDGKPTAVVDKLFAEWETLTTPPSTPEKNNQADRMRNEQSYKEAVMILIPLMETLGLPTNKLVTMRDWENPDGPAYYIEYNRMILLQQTLNAHNNATNDIVLDLGIDVLQPLLEGREYEVAVTLVPSLKTGSTAISPPPAPKTLQPKKLTIPAGTKTLKNYPILTNTEIAAERSTLNQNYQYKNAIVKLTITKPGLATRSTDHTISIN